MRIASGAKRVQERCHGLDDFQFPEHPQGRRVFEFTGSRLVLPQLIKEDHGEPNLLFPRDRVRPLDSLDSGT